MKWLLRIEPAKAILQFMTIESSLSVFSIVVIDIIPSLS
jgi:hypothetical protein